jgi:ABC-type multidrug transport system fused ATPase/permease subunit
MIAIAGRSSFVMAHRLGTTRRCDRIIQIERGQVVGTDGRQQPMWVRS